MKAKGNILMQAMLVKSCADKANSEASDAALEAGRMLRWLIESNGSAEAIALAATVAALAEAAKKIANDAAHDAGRLVSEVL